ncbi:MAG: hypothetical protein CMI00_08790 [Oceanospirillaceae bacterium]|nr:hypothetical protein [Oceanospirillaceae bacterium]|tara:strand:- start:8979 stop:10958 length:1980 start_codon:yes stop_codon:yes gene_type:complete
MSQKQKWSRRELNAIDKASWPTVREDSLPIDMAEKFRSRKTAVNLYIDGISTKDIEARTGIIRSNLPRLIKRCMNVHPDGRVWGYRALIPNIRVADYIRTKPAGIKRPQQRGGHSGALRALLNEHPGLYEKLVDLILKKSKALRINEHKISGTILHKIFLESLPGFGVSKNQWPYTTLNLGRRSIQQFMKDIVSEHFSKSVSATGESNAKAHMPLGTGHSKILAFSEPYDAIEIDAYSINAMLCVTFKNPEGIDVEVVLERLWLIAAVDHASTAVLGYELVYSSEVSAEDVVRLISRSASQKWHPKDLHIKGLRYPESGGFPSSEIKDCYCAAWSCLLLDGALAHLSTSVREHARRRLGFILNWGPVGHFERRPNVERFFKGLSDNVFRRLPSTTGSNPGVGRAIDPEEKARKYKINAEEVESLVDVYIASHNGTPTEGLTFLSPLEFIKHFSGLGPEKFIFRHTLHDGESSIAIPSAMTCTIRGNIKHGRRPYIQIDRVRYTSAVLSQTPALIGKKISIEIDEDDMRQVKAYLTNGAELGFLKAIGQWGVTKHSRKTRKAINSLIHKRILSIASMDDPIQAYLQHLASIDQKKSQSTPNPSCALKAARVAKESGIQPKITNRQEPNNISAKTSRVNDKPDEVIGELKLDLNALVNRKR